MKPRSTSIKIIILRLVTVFLIVSTGTVSTISVINLYNNSSEQIISDVSQKNSTLTAKLNGAFTRYLACVDQLAQLIHTNPGLSREDCERFMGALLNSSYTKGEYYDIFIGYTDGVGIHGSGWVPPYPEWQSFNRIWWKVAENSPGKPVFCPPYLDMDTGKLGISASATVNPNNVSEGVVGVDLPLSDLVEYVNELNAMPISQTFIVNSAGEIIIHPDANFAPSEDGTMQNFAQVEGGKYAKLWHQISSGSRIEKTNITGDPREIYISDRLDNGWYAVSKFPFDTIMRPVYNLISIDLFIFVFVLILCSVILVAIIKRLVTQPLETITATALKLSDGYVDMQADETYAGELGKLSKSFNRIIKNTLINEKATERMANGDYTSVIEIRSAGDIFGVSLNKLNKRLDDMQTQIAIQIQEYELLGRTDPLTGIPNRRDFDEHLKLEWKRAVRNKTPISFLMFDIDKFKIYNDTYGHPQGDTLLKTVANIIFNAARRPADLAARLGGEEFCLLMPETELSKALLVAERIRAETEATRVPTVDGTVTSVTVSIGAVSMVPDTDDSVAEFISKADKHLYTAKESGRNRICSDK